MSILVLHLDLSRHANHFVVISLTACFSPPPPHFIDEDEEDDDEDDDGE